MYNIYIYINIFHFTVPPLISLDLVPFSSLLFPTSLLLCIQKNFENFQFRDFTPIDFFFSCLLLLHVFVTIHYPIIYLTPSLSHILEIYEPHPHLESNHDSSIVQPEVYSPYRLSYRDPHRDVNTKYIILIVLYKFCRIWDYRGIGFRFFGGVTDTPSYP